MLACHLASWKTPATQGFEQFNSIPMVSLFAEREATIGHRTAPGMVAPERHDVTLDFLEHERAI